MPSVRLRITVTLPSALSETGFSRLIVTFDGTKGSSSKILIPAADATEISPLVALSRANTRSWLPVLLSSLTILIFAVALSSPGAK